MKKIIFVLAAVMLCSSLILSVAATDNVDDKNVQVTLPETGTVLSDETEWETNSTQNESSENPTESEFDENESPDRESETENLGAIDGEDMGEIMDIIDGADSRSDAIVKLCERFGFTVEEAEAYINAFIAFGDEHFSDNSWWGAVRADVQNNTRTWAVILVVLFAALVSAAALIINIANKRKQKFQALQMEAFCSDMQEKYSSDRRQLTELESFVYENLKRNTDEVNAFRAMVKEFCDALAEKNDQMLSLKKDITRSREVAESTQKLNETSALYNLQVLYFMMGRSKLPIGDATTRKLWYQEHQKELRALMSPDELDEALNQKQGKE